MTDRTTSEQSQKAPDTPPKSVADVEVGEANVQNSSDHDSSAEVPFEEREMMSMSEWRANRPEPVPKDVPLWQNPWLIGFVFLIVFVTMARPALRNVPPVLPSAGPVPVVEWVTLEGEPFRLADHQAYIISTDCYSQVECTDRLADASKVAHVFEQTSETEAHVIRVVLDATISSKEAANLVGTAGDAGVSMTWIRPANLEEQQLWQREMETLFAARPEVPHRRGVAPPPEAEELDWRERLILVGPDHTVRAFLFRQDPLIVSEAMHRTRALLADHAGRP